MEKLSAAVLSKKPAESAIFQELATSESGTSSAPIQPVNVFPLSPSATCGVKSILSQSQQPQTDLHGAVLKDNFLCYNPLQQQFL